MVKKLLAGLVLLCSVFSASSLFAQDQNAKDEKIITEYLAKNKIKAVRTASGLYYNITQKGTGANATPGMKVSMNYIGKFLDGKKFDGNIDDNYQPVNGRGPFEFTLGVGQVIRGWDEGVQLLNKGCRATLYLPSSVGYGAGGAGPIPPNSVLVFDVELLGMSK